MPSCGNCGSCCKDFSSREPGKPNLASIDVMGGIVEQAVRNTLRRMDEVQAGSMSPQEASDADERLTDWLTQTLCGRNKHFASAEGWNPCGLADYLREVFAGDLERLAAHAPRSDGEVIRWVCERFLDGLYELVSEMGQVAETRQQLLGQSVKLRGFVNFWQAVLVGAPW